LFQNADSRAIPEVEIEVSTMRTVSSSVPVLLRPIAAGRALRPYSRCLLSQIDQSGLGRERTVHTYSQRSEFTSVVTQLSKKPAVVDAHVIEDVEALLLRPDQLSAMMVSEADLGEKIMRALILRRGLVIEHGYGAVLVGDSGNTRLLALQNFLRRNSFPNTVLDAEHDAEAVALFARLTP
jgi:thioredoxin reductase (NADPH)